ncbi:undecaprenyl-diphosphatase [Peptoniphilus ivorii]|uniref:undecaprenyl-diphosphate phosphatase n=1 Tax=Aedoeadaptatus ivorii TaxID=54006 RepID=UPI0027800689|nr:undecaprenyl-diphosphate phosphatase [Peptoniphilus ivorii]MDQ0508860.1 undecaprenyl-diphosphatase [Peptoniphilus ivorii]
MDILKVLFLGIIEGVTEFLPISSTGHLILAHEFVSLDPQSFQNAFDVCIQLGAILAVVLLYFSKLWPFRKNDSGETRIDARTMQLWLRVLVGVIPSAVLGFLFDDFIDAHLFRPEVVAVTLVLYGALILAIERRNKKRRSEKRIQRVEDIPYGMALLIGLFQCLAMIPGTSRSAATILGALILGVGRGAAAEFSFFLAIPTMFGATLLKTVKNGLLFSAYQWFLILLGGVVSFFVAVFVIRKFMAYIRKRDFQIFGYYRIALGIIVFLYFQFQ